MANFIEIETLEDLERIFEKSKHQSVVLFKHSVTCPISTGVYYEMNAVDGDVNLVVVQAARAISNEIAAKTGIRHESPQAIVLKGGRAVFHASHYDITANDIKRVTSNE
ncbi:MAG: bacillithiol system redox-active protein YtxJ [Acidobacteria bacterium]|nr:bacillithiol system redox-active protein YtxJ [Acidobacteriota bacterium]